MSKIICQCGDAIQPDDDALCGACALDFHANKRTIERLKRELAAVKNENANLKTEIAHLQADNRSLVEQVKQITLKPNQEIIEWHQHLLYPETSRCCIVECADNCFYIAHHSDIDGWLNSATYEQLSNVKSWAYLPIGKNYIKAQVEE